MSVATQSPGFWGKGKYFYSLLVVDRLYQRNLVAIDNIGNFHRLQGGFPNKASACSGSESALSRDSGLNQGHTPKTCYYCVLPPQESYVHTHMSTQLTDLLSLSPSTALLCPLRTFLCFGGGGWEDGGEKWWGLHWNLLYLRSILRPEFSIA